MRVMTSGHGQAGSPVTDWPGSLTQHDAFTLTTLPATQNFKGGGWERNFQCCPVQCYRTNGRAPASLRPHEAQSRLVPDISDYPMREIHAKLKSYFFIHIHKVLIKWRKNTDNTFICVVTSVHCSFIIHRVDDGKISFFLLSISSYKLKSFACHICINNRGI